MNFDDYWPQLVDRVYNQNEVLTGNEELFYRWTCIYGETMVDGIESYFERRFTDFESDMQALRTAGFEILADEFQHARRLIFGTQSLEESFVENRITELLSESAEVQPILQELQMIYERMMPQLQELADYRYQFGLRENLYSEDSK